MQAIDVGRVREAVHGALYALHADQSPAPPHAAARISVNFGLDPPSSLDDDNGPRAEVTLEEFSVGVDAVQGKDGAWVAAVAGSVGVCVAGSYWRPEPGGPAKSGGLVALERIAALVMAALLGVSEAEAGAGADQWVSVTGVGYEFLGADEEYATARGRVWFRGAAQRASGDALDAPVYA